MSCSLFFAFVLHGFNAPASAQSGQPYLYLYLNQKKSTSDRERAGMVIPRGPDFVLKDGEKSITPKGVVLTYRIEATEGDRLRLTAQGWHGWAPAKSVIAYNEAEAYFTKEIQSNPRDWFAHVARGMIRDDKNDRHGALADVEEAIRLKPQSSAAWCARAFMNIGMERESLSFTDLNQAIALEPDCAIAYAERGVLWVMRKDYNKAENDFNQALRLGSRWATIHLCRGMMHLERMELDEALAKLRCAAECDPKRADTQLLIGFAFLLREEPREALSALNKAIELDPKFSDAFSARSGCWLMKGDIKKALEDIDESIRLNPKGVRLYTTRAAMLYDSKQYDRSLADVEHALLLNPNDIEAHFARAWMKATCPVANFRDGKAAVAAATRACELTRWQRPRSLTALAAAYAENADFAEAIKWQRKALSLVDRSDPDRGWHLKILGLFADGKPYRDEGESK
jgi:tetratricopeptide (TPR) repeat protein